MFEEEFRALVILVYEEILSNYLSIPFDFTIRRSPCRKHEDSINRKFYRSLICVVGSICPLSWNACGLFNFG